ncbi:MAG: M48 family metallopeptidase [Elusimicrobia bacterium]|nr:M48 family metallopeptidase [Elusimicrobiota bacterium]
METKTDVAGWLESLRIHPGIKSSDYEYDADRKALEAFKAVPGADWLCGKFLEVILELNLAEMLGGAVRVSAKQFPEIDRLRLKCAEILCMEPPPVFVFEGIGINAFTVGPDPERSSVFITRAAADIAQERELTFILGHEMGHIKSQHSLYLTVASFLAGTGIWALRKMEVPGAAYIRILLGLPAQLALNAWARRAEITSDRAGVLCCQDLDLARKALLLLACGSRKLVDRIDLEEFHRQNEDLSQSFAKWGEVFKTHPNLPKRVRALELFSESHFYRRILLGDSSFPARSQSDMDASVYKLLGDTEPAAVKIRELQDAGKAVAKSIAEMGEPILKRGKTELGKGLGALSRGLLAVSEHLDHAPGKTKARAKKSAKRSKAK